MYRPIIPSRALLRFPMGGPELWPFLGTKPPSRSILSFARLIRTAISRAVPKIIIIGCTGAPSHIREIERFVCLFFFFFPAFSGSRTAPNGESHKGQRWLKRRGFRKGFAFLVPLIPSFWKGSKAKKTAKFWPQKEISSITKILDSTSYVKR